MADLHTAIYAQNITNLVIALLIKVYIVCSIIEKSYAHDIGK
ncbi:hypothetical protein SAMN04487951_101353 [Vreelandella arcis]|uniref:Uncharacterized protein n=1 Tax=Vreelandella arcis TaxID=416873 RepID=A0A1G9XN84_9GAMM|nr:hypothetical protein SAMN04487951_101353 [Halomonas arcis]